MAQSVTFLSHAVFSGQLCNEAYAPSCSDRKYIDHASPFSDIGLKSIKGAKAVGGVVGENVKEIASDWNRNRQMDAIEKSGNKEDIRDSSGNVVGHRYTQKGKSWLRGRDKVKTVEVSANGTRSLSSQKDYGDGRIKKTVSDGYVKQEIIEKDGVVVGSNLSIESAGLKSMKNRDGSINMVALDAALQNSAHDKRIVMAAAMQQLGKETFIIDDIDNSLG